MERRRPRVGPVRPLVLIVDGHEDTREMYACALASFEFETVTDDDGQQAFGRAWQTHPDVIVTEIWFPTFDGWHLVHDLKRDRRTRDIPIVVLTSRVDKSVRQRAEREGCAAVLLKPCLPEDLAHTLRELLHRATANDIARRGYELCEARDGEPGADLDDWLQAKRELPGAGDVDGSER